MQRRYTSAATVAALTLGFLAFFVIVALTWSAAAPTGPAAAEGHAAGAGFGGGGIRSW